MSSKRQTCRDNACIIPEKVGCNMGHKLTDCPHYVNTELEKLQKEHTGLQQTIAGLEADMMDARETIAQLKQECQRLRDCLMGACNTTFTESKR